MIDLPLLVDNTAPDMANLNIIQEEAIRVIAKRKAMLNNSLKKGFVAVYNQCSQEVKDKLESSNDWDKTRCDQSLHSLITKIGQICVGFDNHKQEVFNLVQSLKTLILYTQGEKATTEEYLQNFKSLWNTVEAFGGSPGVHKGLVDGLLADTSWVKDVDNVTSAEWARAKEDTCELAKAALLISSADKRRYRQLKEQLANNYLLGRDQYPNTLKKVSMILGNYQVGRPSPFGERRGRNEAGFAFLQKRGCGGQGRRAGKKGSSEANQDQGT
jgi:hypothetical protein